MSCRKARSALSITASLMALSLCRTAHADSGDSGGATPAAGQPEITVTAQRLNDARENIKPSLGAVTYTIDQAAIQNLPGSDNQPIQDIILQMPGISQDQFGQFHVRDEHNGVQYRLNGVIIPESIAVFGQMLSPRLVEKMALITGTLPAQYGLRTAGILDITTKSGLKDSTTVGLYGGSYNTIEPSVQLSGSSGPTSWLFTGDYKHSDLGIDNVNGSTHAVHDRTDQYNGFGYIDHILGANDRIALMGGYARQSYQIPNQAGPTATMSDPLTDAGGRPVTINGITSFNSADLDERQMQIFGFAALSWLHSAGAFSAQMSLYGRIANLDYRPDYAGDLLFNGLAQTASKRDITIGAQFDSSLRLSDSHTLRAGFQLERDHSRSWTDTSAFPTDDDGAIVGAPVAFTDITAITQRTYSLYLQDEWHITRHLVANFGARFDENDGVRNERQLSPRANLVWTPDRMTTLHAGYARYFSPAPFELIAGTNLAQVRNTTAAPDITLDTPTYAQREHYFDIGIERRLGHGLTIGLDAYDRIITHLVDEGQFGAPIILTPFNYAKGRIKGVEFSLNYTHGGFSAYGNVAWARARGTNIDSNQYNFSASDLAYIATHWILLDHDQTWTSSAGASYHWRSGILAGSRISADMNFGSGLREEGPPPPDSPYADTPNGKALPDYVNFNLSIGHKFTRSGFDVHLDIVNLFDSIYEIRSGTGVGVGAPSYGQRRSIFIGVSKTL